MIKMIGETLGLCDFVNCGEIVPIKIINENGKIYYKKDCPNHGAHIRLISTDAEYYNHSHNVSLKLQTRFQKGNNPNCPNNCNDCCSHISKIGYLIIEITDKCDFQCKTCIASSGSGQEVDKNDIKRRINSYVESNGKPGLIFVSGGEPTTHSDFFEILDFVKTKAERVFIITNGIRISMDECFLENLSHYRECVEIYLQFDSLKSEFLEDIRGSGVFLSNVRRRAVENLDRIGVNSTLVCIAKNNVNIDDLGNVIKYALNHDYVRGVTIQPLKFIGRVCLDNIEESYITLSQIREAMIKNIDVPFSENDIIPHYFNPENISIGYYDKMKKTAVTREMDKRGLLQNKFFFTPEESTIRFDYHNLFRLAIVSFFDRFSFNLDTIRQSAICFINNEGKAIPQNTYYWRYRG